MAAVLLRANHHPDCYPSHGEEALDFFRKALTSNEKSNAIRNIQGIITPHIDFRVSLRSYAAAFSPLLNLPLAETYLILGVGHRSRVEWNLDRRDYLTPLGQATCARDLVDRLAPDLPIFFGPEGHAGEHSIEFPLVWLQALHSLHPSGANKPVRFIPLLCGGLHALVEGMVELDALADFHHLRATLAELFEEQLSDGRLRIIVSIDGCHIGPRFRDPFEVTPALLKVTAAWEERLWGVAAKGDLHAFLDWMRDEGNDRNFDGVGALALLLAAGEGKFRLQRTHYEQWFTKNDASVVTFSSGRVQTA